MIDENPSESDKMLPLIPLTSQGKLKLKFMEKTPNSRKYTSSILCDKLHLLKVDEILGKLVETGQE